MHSTRRSFLRTTALGTAALPLFPTLLTQPASAQAGAKPPLERVRLGFIGLGERGRNHLQQAIYRPDIQITALCDIDSMSLDKATAQLQKAGRPVPPTFT